MQRLDADLAPEVVAAAEANGMVIGQQVDFLRSLIWSYA
jgi:hypothetical protein